MIDVTHDLSHYAIWLGYVAAMIFLPLSLLSLVRLSIWTTLAGAGFFVFCGITHVGLVFDASNSPFITATDHIQGVAIWVFVIGLTYDLGAAAARVATAWRRLEEQYGWEIVRTIRREISIAMRGKPDLV